LGAKLSGLWIVTFFFFLGPKPKTIALHMLILRGSQNVFLCLTMVTWFLAADDEPGFDSSWAVVGTPVLRVKTIYISSAILAAKSPFFFKVIEIAS
jgi:hypothetical protein